MQLIRDETQIAFKKLVAYLREGYQLMTTLKIALDIKQDVVFLENEILPVEKKLENINLYKNPE